MSSSPSIAKPAAVSLATEATGRADGSSSEMGDYTVHELELEAAHAALRSAAQFLERDASPLIDLDGSARAIEKALSDVFDAFDGRRDPLEATRDAQREIDRTLAMLSHQGHEAAFGAARDHLSRARGHLVRAEERLLHMVFPGVAPCPDILASRDAPRLHSVRRSSLIPSINPPKAAVPHVMDALPPPIGQPRSFAELREAIGELKRRPVARAVRSPVAEMPEPPRAPVLPPGFVGAVDRALDDAAFVRHRTRECFEEVAMVGMQRAPLLGDPWRFAGILEKRMFASIDVVAAMGRAAIEHVATLVVDAPVKDPTRAFAMAMLLGCVAGRDALALAEYVALSLDPDPPFVDELAAAWKLVPHPHLGLAMRTLLHDASAIMRSTAIDVLGYRGLATDAELAHAATQEPSVASRALVHLGLRGSAALRDLLPSALDADDASVRDAAWTAMALTGISDPSRVLRTALAGTGGDSAATLLAIAGDESDAKHLLERVQKEPRPALVTALGWAGSAMALVPLIDVLAQSREDEVRYAAAWALERLTGAGLFEEVPVEDEALEVAEPPDPDVGERDAPRLARLVSDPRDMPEVPAPELVEQPTIDPARWRAYCAEHCARWDAKGRYRRGRPYSPAVVLDELDTGRCTPAERRLLQRELVIRTGHFVPFDPHDFVAVQEESLRAWRPIAARTSATPGRWSRPHRRVT